jgi:hypothetical protein
MLNFTLILNPSLWDIVDADKVNGSWVEMVVLVAVVSEVGVTVAVDWSRGRDQGEQIG